MLIYTAQFTATSWLKCLVEGSITKVRQDFKLTTLDMTVLVIWNMLLKLVFPCHCGHKITPHLESMIAKLPKYHLKPIIRLTKQVRRQIFFMGAQKLAQRLVRLFLWW